MPTKNGGTRGQRTGRSKKQRTLSASRDDSTAAATSAIPVGRNSCLTLSWQNPSTRSRVLQ